MKIQFKSNHESIGPFQSIDLPDFTILTGVNGSGKTHLMRAIQAGKVAVDSIPLHDISYYTYKDFLVPNNSTLNSQQIEAQRQAIWKQFNGTWKTTLQNLHNQAFLTNEDGQNIDLLAQDLPENVSIWEAYHNSRLVSNRLSLRIQQYVQMLKQQVFKNENFKKNPHHISLTKALRKTDRLLHEITEDEFRERFVPSINTNNHLAISLGAIFTKYRVNQFLWAHRQFDEGATASSKQDLYNLRGKT